MDFSSKFCKTLLTWLGQGEFPWRPSGHSLYKYSLPPSEVEWLSWPPVVFTAYLLAACFVLFVVVYRLFVSITERNKEKKKQRHLKPSFGRQVNKEPIFGTASESDLASTSEILPAPTPEKVWSKGVFGRPHDDEVSRLRDNATAGTMPQRIAEKFKPGETPRPPLTQATCDNCGKIKYQRVEFRWYGKANKVFLTGSFLKWSTMVEMTKVMDSFFVCFDLPRGHHEFKFQVDGNWRHNETYPVVKSLVGEDRNYIHQS